MAHRLIGIGISAVMVLLPSFGLVSGPAFAGLTITLLLLSLARCQSNQIRLELRRFDWRLWCLAVGFSLWSALGAIGNPNAATVVHQSLQVGLIFFGALLLIEVARQTAASLAPHQQGLIRLVALGLVLGVLTLAIDRALGYPLRELVVKNNHPTQYNRGIAYVCLLILPAIAYALEQRLWRSLVLLLGGGVLAIGLGSNSTAVVAAVVGAITIAIAYYFPRLMRLGLQIIVGLVFVIAPWILGAISSLHRQFSGVIKGSAVHRLEIWNYMSQRISAHPVMGWGLGTAKDLSVSEAEREQYLYAGTEGIYPHNQLLQLWVETGAVGVFLFLLFLQLVIVTVSQFTGWYRHLGYGALVMALTTALVNYEITTDSWWDCLAVTAALFMILRQNQRRA
ncbi:MAG: O-antigen ligase family protein [Alphaproteobacteria bacterium]|nr:O-antigen ligase family protein [Alphaproteobacteria bacterium]